jgi:hypothetical protein
MYLVLNHILSFFFNFILWHLIFISDFIPMLLIAMYSVLNLLLKYFFFNFIHWHLIFISNLVFILLIIIFIFSISFIDIFFAIFILLLIEIVFHFHPLWFDLIFFLCPIWFSFFSNLYFFLFYPFFILFFKCILNILVSLEFYKVIFLGLPLYHV